MITTKSWSETRDKVLADPATAIEYLNQELNEPDPVWFLRALRHVAEANGGMAAIAERAGLGRESLYKALSGKRNAKWSTVLAVLRAAGVQITFTAAPLIREPELAPPKPKRKRKAA